jgi:hypothetical protein
MEQYRRLIHCSDLKREILYIKDNNEWTKEDTEKPLLTKAIKIIANEGIKKISEWKLVNPRLLRQRFQEKQCVFKHC